MINLLSFSEMDIISKSSVNIIWPHRVEFTFTFMIFIILSVLPGLVSVEYNDAICSCHMSHICIYNI